MAEELQPSRWYWWNSEEAEEILRAFAEREKVAGYSVIMVFAQVLRMIAVFQRVDEDADPANLPGSPLFSN
jgi:hypothetical protein